MAGLQGVKQQGVKQQGVKQKGVKQQRGAKAVVEEGLLARPGFSAEGPAMVSI